MLRTRAGAVALALLVASACSSDAPAPDAEVEASPDPEAAAAEAGLFCVTGADAAALAERASPLDSLSFQLSSGPAKLCYGRPSANGRVMVGGLDPFDAPWRMGANEPTTLHVAGEAMIGDVHVTAGSYRLYAIPTEAGPWTIVVNGTPTGWGVPISDEVRAADIGTIEVTPAPMDEAVGTLTFSYEEGALVFSFESRTLTIPIMGH